MRPQLPWGADAGEHTVDRYTSCCAAWQARALELREGPPREEEVSEEALAGLPRGARAFRQLLAELFPELGSSQQPARKAVREGCVLLDGEAVSWDTPLPRAGQRLTLRQRSWFGGQHRDCVPQKLHNRTSNKGDDDAIFIIAEPAAPEVGIFFVHKPSGVESKPWANAIGKCLTFEEFLPCVLPCVSASGGSGELHAEAIQLAESREPAWLMYPRVAHRLDCRVSGIVSVATTHEALRHLQACFEGRSAQKTYRAIVAGDLSAHPWWQTHSPEEPLLIDSAVAGRASQTEVLVLEVSPSSHFGAITTASLKPMTGRQHQLREHLASLGFPIIGDTEHWDLATDAWQQRLGQPLPAMCPVHGPLYLQAIALQLPLPGDGGMTGFSIPEAQKFARLRRKVRSCADASISHDEARAARHDVDAGKLA